MEQFFYQCEKNGCFLEQYVYHIGSYHYNWHRELELMTVLRGELEVCIDGASHLLRDSDVILIGSNKGHATLARQPESVAMVLHIAPDLFREYYGDMDALQFTCCSEGGRKNERPFVLLRAHLASLMLSAQGQGAEEKLRFESALYALLHTLSLYFPPERLSTGKAMLLRNTFDAVEKIVQYIDANYMQKITLNDLAQVSKYNRNYISQFFKSNLGVNFHDYLTRIRLREATLALGQTDQSVSEIALSHGFSDLKSFNTVFRARFSKTPTEYRRQLNETVTKYDPRFKRDFLPRADEAMNQILLQYVLDRRVFSRPPPVWRRSCGSCHNSFFFHPAFLNISPMENIQTPSGISVCRGSRNFPLHGRKSSGWGGNFFMHGYATRPKSYGFPALLCTLCTINCGTFG